MSLCTFRADAGSLSVHSLSVRYTQCALKVRIRRRYLDWQFPVGSINRLGASTIAAFPSIPQFLRITELGLRELTKPELSLTISAAADASAVVVLRGWRSALSAALCCRSTRNLRTWIGVGVRRFP